MGWKAMKLGLAEKGQSHPPAAYRDSPSESPRPFLQDGQGRAIEFQVVNIMLGWELYSRPYRQNRGDSAIVAPTWREFSNLSAHKPVDNCRAGSS
jgi:hypothetical protein